ncbi:Sialidase [Talaromyces proteolyticus]|uniref:Sialidase n=1 Tax=Talaromyces proteolyticus TaxID=1131652 RepID=A0AAD4PUH2_9EURO|nr:Sialidase [Talaromyces proteolyticus]KAH8692200.1 Sialidase [Talaromyces proteolyticus]
MVDFRLVAWLSAAVLLFTPSLTSSIDKRAGTTARLSGGQIVMGAGTYPRANFLQDGSIIGAYTASVNNNMIITAVHSTDGGNTWNEIGTVAQADASTHDLDNPYPFQLPSGRILMAMRNHDRTTDPGTGKVTYTFFRITICYSDDGGTTWSYLSTPASDPGSVNGNWEPFLRMAEDNKTLQLYYSRENSRADQDSLMRTSIDGGSTWSGATVISGGDTTSTRDGMLGVTLISGTNLIAVFESIDTSVTNGHFGVYSVTSSDDGQTWGNRQTVYAPDGFDAQSPQVTNVGGTLVCSFQTDEDLSAPDFSAEAGKIVTSGDGGATWGNKLTFSPAVSNWGGLLAIDDTSLFALVDRSGAKAQKVILA